MFVNTFKRRLLFNFVLLFALFLAYYLTFRRIYISDTIIFSFAVHPFNLCTRYPKLWYYMKLIYIPTAFISSLICINIVYSTFFTKKKTKSETRLTSSSDLYLTIYNSSNKNLIIPESGLYQNFLITGTIGSGKTSSVMYPFTRQLISYCHEDTLKKLGMLILDVKGNYYAQVKKYAKFYNRDDDLIIIELRTEM